MVTNIKSAKQLLRFEDDIKKTLFQDSTPLSSAVITKLDEPLIRPFM